MRPSTTQLKSALERLGLKQSELAVLVNVSSRTVSQWATGAKPLPAAVEGYLRLLATAPDPLRQSELARLDDPSKRLLEGAYRVGCLMSEEGIILDAVAVLAGGKITGATALGEPFSGSYVYDRLKGVSLVRAVLAAPLDGALDGRPGQAAGRREPYPPPTPRPRELRFAIRRPEPTASVPVKLDGRAVILELTYLGPLPN